MLRSTGSRTLSLLAATALLAVACATDDDPETSPAGDNAAVGAPGTDAEAGAPDVAGDVAGDIAPPVEPTPGAAASGVTVTGAGVVSGAPDVVQLTAGVEVERDDVQTALDDANVATNQVLQALDDAGIAEEDRQTRDFAIQPSMNQDGEIAGYLVRNLVEATVYEVDTVGDVVQGVADAAGDDARLHGVRFDLEEDSELLVAARQAALEDARIQAEHYADLAGVELGQLVAIEDHTVSQPRQGQMEQMEMDAAAADDAAAAPVPIEGGEHDVTVRVVTRWALG